MQRTHFTVDYTLYSPIYKDIIISCIIIIYEVGFSDHKPVFFNVYS